MLLLAACVLALLSPLLAGRWPATVLLHRWRWTPLIWATLLLQVAVIEVPLPGVIAPVLHVMTYLPVLAFLWANRAIRTVLLVAVGTASNGITIALNGGVLPASRRAVAAAAIDPHAAFANSAVVADPRLAWLGDVFAWPAPMVFANTFSVGDVLIAVGVLSAAWTGTRRLGLLPRPGDAEISEPRAPDLAGRSRVRGGSRTGPAEPDESGDIGDQAGDRAPRGGSRHEISGQVADAGGSAMPGDRPIITAGK